MKYLKLLVFLQFFTLVFSCSSQTQSNRFLQREWKLVAMDSFSKQDLISHNISFNLTYNNHPIAYSSCSEIPLIVYQKNGRFKFKFQDSQKTFHNSNCSSLENQFFQYLKTIRFYEINGHFLTLRTEDGKTLKFIAADWD